MLCSVDLFPVPDKILDSNIPVPTSPAASHIPDFGVNTPSQASSSASSSPGIRNVQLRTSRVSSTQFSPPFELTSSGALKLNYLAPDNTGENTYTYFPLHPFTTPSAEGSVAAPRISPFQIPRRQPMLSQLNEAEPPSDIVLRIGNHLVTESSKLTPALVGERFVEPTLIDYKGKKCLIFVFGVWLFFFLVLSSPKRPSAPGSISCVLLNMFRPWTIYSFTPYFTLFLTTLFGCFSSLFPTLFFLFFPHFCGTSNWSGLRLDQDLAVQREGTFIFRYRAFDIFSAVPGGQEQPILAELYGGPFRVYSTREFPGLEPSTDLTRVRAFSISYRPLLTFVLFLWSIFFLGLPNHWCGMLPLKCLTWVMFNVDLQSLAKYGVRVTLRDAERKSRKRSNSERDSWLGERRRKTQWIAIDFYLCGG